MSAISPAASANGAAAQSSVRPAGDALPASVLPGPVSEPAARLLAVLGLAAIAVIHILDAQGTFTDGTRYIFWLYIAAVVGVIPVSLVLLHWGSPLAWAGVAALAAGPLLGFILTRSVGLPRDSADIGNWLEPLGMASMFVEAGVISLALVRLGLGFGFRLGRGGLIRG